MGDAAPIGFVLGTKPASSLEFYVLVDQHNYLEMDDVVYVRSRVEGYAGVDEVTFYGTVVEVQQYHEGVQFDSDTNIVRQGIMPAGVAYIGRVQVTKLEPECSSRRTLQTACTAPLAQTWTRLSASIR